MLDLVLVGPTRYHQADKWQLGEWKTFNPQFLIFQYKIRLVRVYNLFKIIKKIDAYNSWDFSEYDKYDKENCSSTM